MSTDALWYTARGAGITSLLLLTITMALGIATASGRPLPGLPRFAVALIHRNAALLAVVLLVVHVVTLLFDPYAGLRLLDLVLPFDASYRPIWVGLGTLSLDLLLAVVITSLLRHRLGLRSWKAVHWLAYLSWPTAVLHGFFAGSDAGAWWFRGLAVACVAVVGAAVAWRLSAGFRRTDLRRPARAGARAVEGSGVR